MNLMSGDKTLQTVRAMSRIFLEKIGVVRTRKTETESLVSHAAGYSDPASAGVSPNLECLSVSISLRSSVGTGIALPDPSTAATPSLPITGQLF